MAGLASLERRPPRRNTVASLWSRSIVLLWVVAALWILELLDQLLLNETLDRLGLRPRDVDQWWGIFTAPFLHGGFPHLVANTLPLLVLGWLVILRGTRTFVLVTLMAMVFGGAAVWLFGAPNSIHIGASGVIFAFIGYLLMRGFFERSFSSIAVAILVGVVYGGALFGVLPGQRGVSWEGHLFGFLSGAAAARLLASR